MTDTETGLYSIRNCFRPSNKKTATAPRWVGGKVVPSVLKAPVINKKGAVANPKSGTATALIFRQLYEDFEILLKSNKLFKTKQQRHAASEIRCRFCVIFEGLFF